MTSSTEARGDGRAGRRSFDFGKLLLEGRAFLALVVIIIVFSILSKNYFSTENFLTMSSHVAVYAILAIGMLLVILNGGIDLTVGSTLGLSGVIAGFLMKGVALSWFGVRAFPPVWVVVILCCAVGALIGLVNGVLVARFKVAPFVATLGMLYVVRGIALLITNGLTYNNLEGDPELGNTGFDWLGFNRILNIPIGVVVLALIAIIVSLVLNRSVFGRWLYASGGNERAAELSGVPVRRVKVWVYVASGVCAAIAGLILSSELTSAGPTAGQSYELTAIAAVVIGGAALTGGRGNIRGTLLGGFVIGFLSDGLVIVGVSAYWQTVFIGAVIILAVLLNSIQYRGRRTRTPSGGSKSQTGQTPSADIGSTGATGQTPPVDTGSPQTKQSGV
jgi:erythritol transport system permease protein